MEKGIALLAVLSLMITVSAIAQKLPNVQEKSLRAPASIKVDGKATEWNNEFQAYNKAIECYYTISNDNDKLYLTVQATDLDIINKIICKGIALTINGTGKMKDQEGVAITFPVLNDDAFPRGQRGEAHAGMAIYLDKPASWPADSFMVVLNKDLSSKAKDIKVTGVKEITNSLISIYNPEGIKAVALFDNKTIFTYELAVPLKYLGLSVKNPKPFVYNIKLPGWNPDLTNGAAVSASLRTQRPALRRDFTKYGPDPVTRLFDFDGPTVPRLKQLFGPSNFWGEYTLAK